MQFTSHPGPSNVALINARSSFRALLGISSIFSCFERFWQSHGHFCSQPFPCSFLGHHFPPIPCPSSPACCVFCARSKVIVHDLPNLGQVLLHGLRHCRLHIWVRGLWLNERGMVCWRSRLILRSLLLPLASPWIWKDGRSQVIYLASMLNTPRRISSRSWTSTCILVGAKCPPAVA